MSVYSRRKGQELVGIVLLAFSVLLVLAMFSYSARDASYNVAAPQVPSANWVGQAGAWTADLCFQLLGLAAYLLPIPLLLGGYRKIRRQPIEALYSKLIGFLAILLAVSAGFSLVQPELADWANFSTGGIFGLLLARTLLAVFNPTGSLIVVITVLLLSVVATTRLSLEMTFARLAGLDWNLAARFSTWRQNLRERRQRRQALKELKMERDAVVAQPVPKRRHRKVLFEEPSSGADLHQTQPVDPPTVASLAGPDQEAGHSRAGALTKTTKRGKQKVAFSLPDLEFLREPAEEIPYNEEDLIERARRLATKCSEFDVNGRVLQIHPGPVVTTFEFKPDPGVKYSRITNLEDDLCLALKAESIRIDRIPGKNTVGIEVPNPNRRIIYLREILGSTAFQQSPSKLTLGLGQLINGSTYITDLSRMPHLLIAGATGSGKSVGLNCLVCSILYKSSPQNVRFIMVDPKRLELGVYDGIPHLLTPIVTDPKQAANALQWAVREMEDRYKHLARLGVRDITQYNHYRLERVLSEGGDEEEFPHLPYLVIIVDELADLMMTAGKEVEASLTRLAQMARAVGIHLILATQRPSVDVITGLIKANFPSRISFRVSSKTDSRTILDSNGAEQLLGMGDMLFLSPGTSRLVRIHGALISEKEIARLTDFLQAQAVPEYCEEVLEDCSDAQEGALVDPSEMEDDLYDEAVRFVLESGRASTSLLQRRFRIGYGRAARLLDIMEHERLVGPPEGSKPRQVLVGPEYVSEPDEEF